MKIQELKKQQEEKHSALFKKVGLFWAFSNEQFAANKTPLREGEKYVSIGAGGYLPKGNMTEFEKGMKEINIWFKAEAKRIKFEHIKYELFNHECFYTGDISEACRVLPYSKQTVLKVYQQIRTTVEI